MQKGKAVESRIAMGHLDRVGDFAFTYYVVHLFLPRRVPLHLLSFCWFRWPVADLFDCPCIRQYVLILIVC